MLYQCLTGFREIVALIREGDRDGTSRSSG